MLQAVGGLVRQRLFGTVLPAASVAQQGSLRTWGSASHAEDDDHHEPSYDHTPTVFDKIVNLSVVDLNGKRHAVRGLAGQTLAKALIDAGFPRTYFFPNMGFYTQHIVDAHVFIPKDYHSLVPNFKDGSEQADAIKRTFREIIQDNARDTSYLASYITLSPDMNNMTVGIGPIKPWHLHPSWSFHGVHDDPATQFEQKHVEIWG